MNYIKFQGNRIEEVCTHSKEKSYYNHNYYIDDECNEIYVWSDDDNYSSYSFNGIEFAESFCSKGDIINVYSEFKG